MVIYYIIFILLLYPALNYKDRLRIKKNNLSLKLLLVVIVIFSGLRDSTGGDWGNYVSMYNTFLPYMSYTDALKHSDPLFWLLSLTMYKVGLGFYGTNLVISIIFVIGLYKLLIQQPNPLLGLMVAYPYLIIVVLMGYTRQAAAIGFIMWGLSYIRKKNFYKYIIMVFLATTFHKTAIIMIGIGLFDGKKGKLLKTISVLLVGIGLWSAFVSQEQAMLIHNYIDAQMKSSGAIIRVVMNIIPAYLIIYTKKKWKKYFDDYTFWFIIAVFSFVLLLMLSVASTAVDRIALYFIPIQIVVFSRLPILLKDKINKKIIKLMISLYYFLVLTVWLNFGNFSYWWLPYKNIIFTSVFS
jgi:hypothetical protein